MMPKDDEDPKYIYRWADEGYGGKFTIANGGQLKFGGWSIPGLTKFNQIRKANKKARKTPESQELEAAILLSVRETNGRLALTPGEEKGAKKPKVAAVLAAAPEINCFDSDSEDEDDEN